MSVAWLFPGQGSQRVGMALSWCERSWTARRCVDQAAGVLGIDLPRLMFEGPPAELDETSNAQPALLAASVAILRAAQNDGLPQATCVAGHSMGEYSALVASGALGYEDGLRLVRTRGQLMARAGQANPGRMAAVLGLDVHRVAQACERSGAQIANLNAPGQVVISGSAEGVQRASELARAAGARRVVGLAVSVAAHSRLMQPVADEFARHVRATPIQPARVPVIANATASVIQTPEAITAELCGQLTQPVCWVESIEAMLALGVSTFIEIGSGDVLTGLVRRIADHGVTALSLERPAAMDELRKLERQV